MSRLIDALAVPAFTMFILFIVTHLVTVTPAMAVPAVLVAIALATLWNDVLDAIEAIVLSGFIALARALLRLTRRLGRQ